MRKEKIDPHHFTSFRVLGRGAFGLVSAVKKLDSGKLYAIKMIHKKHAYRSHSLKNILLERDLLTLCESPFVVQLHYAFQDKTYLYLVIDLMMGGDLDFHQKNQPHQRLPEHYVQFFAAEMLLGLEHIHSKKMIFRDLKPGNVLLDMKGHCKISDFGLAVYQTAPQQCLS